MYTVVTFQAQNRLEKQYLNSVAVSFKIITTTSVTIPCFTTHLHTCKTKTDYFWSQTGLVPRPTFSDHITSGYLGRANVLGNREGANYLSNYLSNYLII